MLSIQNVGSNSELFPNLFLKKSSGFLHHLLQLRYVENAITQENIDDILEPAVLGKDHCIQMQLVSEMVKFNDIPAAAKWARRCGLACASLPLVVQDYMMKTRAGCSQNGHHGRERRGGDKEGKKKYLDLSISLSHVIFVDSRETLQGCWEAIAKYNAVIGLDSEWKLICDRSAERLAVMQVAVKDAVYLLDMVTLPQVVAPKTLRHFMHNLFGSNHNLKLGAKVMEVHLCDAGYSICSDLVMLAKSWPFVSDIITDPERVVDLKTLDENIQKLQKSHSTKAAKATSTGNGLPVHPLYQQAATMPTRNALPTHPLFLSAAEEVTPSASCTDHTPCNGNGDCALTSELWEKPISGLSSLVERYLGKPLDKSNQLSDWEKRPLRLDQIRYAALDAHCLLELYARMVDNALKLDPGFNTTPCVQFKPHPNLTENEP